MILTPKEYKNSHLAKKTKNLFELFRKKRLKRILIKLVSKLRRDGVLFDFLFDILPGNVPVTCHYLKIILKTNTDFVNSSVQTYGILVATFLLYCIYLNIV